jgi:hypothetical protein
MRFFISIDYALTGFEGRSRKVWVSPALCVEHRRAKAFPRWDWSKVPTWQSD